MSRMFTRMSIAELFSGPFYPACAGIRIPRQILPWPYPLLHPAREISRCGGTKFLLRARRRKKNLEEETQTRRMSQKRGNGAANSPATNQLISDWRHLSFQQHTRTWRIEGRKAPVASRPAIEIPSLIPARGQETDTAVHVQIPQSAKNMAYSFLLGRISGIFFIGSILCIARNGSMHGVSSRIEPARWVDSISRGMLMRRNTHLMLNIVVSPLCSLSRGCGGYAAPVP